MHYAGVKCNHVAVIVGVIFQIKMAAVKPQSSLSQQPGMQSIDLTKENKSVHIGTGMAISFHRGVNKF
jgi:hypothetical protein